MLQEEYSICLRQQATIIMLNVVECICGRCQSYHQTTQAFISLLKRMDTIPYGEVTDTGPDFAPIW